VAAAAAAAALVEELLLINLLFVVVVVVVDNGVKLIDDVIPFIFDDALLFDSGIFSKIIFLYLFLNKSLKMEKKIFNLFFENLENT
jgi:hypothetical protein